MKKFSLLHMILMTAVLGPVLLTSSCVTSSGGGHGVFAQFSFPLVYITDGTLNFADALNPLTGDDVTNATVTARNVTTSSSMSLSFTANPTRGFYTSGSNFSHLPGEQVALDIQFDDTTITGSSTLTPNPVYSSLSPADNDTVSLPFTISWNAAQQAFNASHTWVILFDSGDNTNNFQIVVPFAQTSVNIDSSMIQPGSFSIQVFGVNMMTFSGADSSSVGYVDGGGIGRSSFPVTVM
jgi:hypothetical protein